MELRGTELISVAEEIARVAHSGQVDKIGVDYIEHPRRIAARFDSATQPNETAVAWLHDVIEDSTFTSAELAERGIPADVIAAVELLTRNHSDSGDNDYYERIRVNPLALAVKLADIADNTDPARTSLLQPDVRERLAVKYAKARVALGID